MSAALYAKLFKQFTAITDAALNNIESHIIPILQGARPLEGETDEKLADLYEEWQAGCRATAAALQRSLYPREETAMPCLPADDEEHQPCRQMAAVMILRTIHNESIAAYWFAKVAQDVLKQPSCANHPKSCACQLVLQGWKHSVNETQVDLLTEFYQANYDGEKDEAYLQAVRDLARHYGITFEQMMEKERAQKAEWEAEEAKAVAKAKGC